MRLKSVKSCFGLTNVVKELGLKFSLITYELLVFDTNVKERTYFIGLENRLKSSIHGPNRKNEERMKGNEIAELRISYSTINVIEVIKPRKIGGTCRTNFKMITACTFLIRRYEGNTPLEKH